MRSRFKSLVHFFTAVSVLVCALVAMPVNATNLAKPQTIVIFGDSLSSAYGITIDEGWVSLLQQRLAKKKDMTKWLTPALLVKPPAAD